MSTNDIGSLAWVERGGGSLTFTERMAFFVSAIPHFAAAAIKAMLHPRASRRVPALNLAELAPPDTPIVQEAIRLLRAHSDPAMANHCFRTAYWTLGVMLREKPSLTPREIEEAWVAALLHDIGLDLPPERAEFTLGGAQAVSRLAARFHWDKESERVASEAITLNPNGWVDRRRFGLLAWAMNVGGYGETSLGPYRALLNPGTVKEIEAMYPRAGFYEAVPRIVGKELERFPNQRFALLKKIGFVKRRLRDDA